ncbi:MAG: T9SS type A sorting domain-containing protein [Saprospiraceae bacterium]|nr:T9SS type A sorting domain-containing protein [Candidatus Opimibacter iunctus]
MPDPTFGVDGKMTLPVSNAYFFFFNSGADILLQKDGKFIFTGSIGDGENDLGLIRLDKNGTPDPLFGNHGFIQTDLGGDERLVQATLQDDDKILLAGTSTYNGFSSIVLARYLNDLSLGSIDLSSSMQEALIYPNPVVDQVVLEFQLTTEETISIQVLDIQGRVIKTLVRNKHLDAGHYRQMLDLSDINIPGCFILQLIGETGAISVKMIK